MSGFCPNCHTRPEWWDPKQGGHRFAFITETDRCPGCEIKGQEQEAIPPDQHGVHVFLKPNPAVHGDPDDLEEVTD